MGSSDARIPDGAAYIYIYIYICFPVGGRLREAARALSPLALRGRAGPHGGLKGPRLIPGHLVLPPRLASLLGAALRRREPSGGGGAGCLG